MLNGELNAGLFLRRLIESHVRKLIETRTVFGEKIRGRIVRHREICLQRCPGFVVFQFVLVVERIHAETTGQGSRYYGSKLAETLLSLYGHREDVLFWSHHRHFGCREQATEQRWTALRIATHRTTETEQNRHSGFAQIQRRHTVILVTALDEICECVEGFNLGENDLFTHFGTTGCNVR